MEANIHDIRLSGYGANTKCLSFGTAGSYGIETLRIETSGLWEGAAITAVFLRKNKSIRVHLGADHLIPVPPEATAEQTTEQNGGMIVFEGVQTDGRVYTTGIRFTVSGHPSAQGDFSQPVTPTEQEQLWTAIQSLNNEIPEIKQEAEAAAQSAALAADSARDAAEAAENAGGGNQYAIGQGLTGFLDSDGKTRLSVSNDIRYTGHGTESMVVGLDTQGGSGIEAVEFTQTEDGHRVTRIGVRTTNDRSENANIAAGIEMGTVAGGTPNAICFITDGGYGGWFAPGHVAFLAHGTEPFLEYDDQTGSLKIGSADGNLLSIAAGTEGDTGRLGQVLTANGDGTCRWAAPPEGTSPAAEYDGSMTVAGDPVLPAQVPTPEYEGRITVV